MAAFKFVIGFFIILSSFNMIESVNCINTAIGIVTAVFGLILMYSGGKNLNDT